MTNWHLLDDGMNYGAADASADGVTTASVATFAMTNELGEACFGLRAAINGVHYLVAGSFYKANDWQSLAEGLIAYVLANAGTVPGNCTLDA